MIQRISIILILVVFLVTQRLEAQEPGNAASSTFAANPSIGLMVSPPTVRSITGGTWLSSSFPEVGLILPLSDQVEWQVSAQVGINGSDIMQVSYGSLANDPLWFEPFQFASGSLCLSNRFLYHLKGRRGISARFGLSLWTVLAAHDDGRIWEVVEQFSVNEGKIGFGLIAGVNFDVNSNIRFSAYVTPQYSRVRWTSTNIFTNEATARISQDELAVPVILEIAVKPF